jgi:pimeloyl-ACP methyl ester carboxylesterase
MLLLTARLRCSISLASTKTHLGRKRNLLVHHGLMGSGKNFRTICRSPAIANRCNSHLIDARNHGASPHTPSHTIEELADDLLQYITENGLDDPQQRLTLMGHSMGGLALMDFTKRHASAHIQACVDRVIIIDIPSDPVRNYPSYQNTGNMLRSLSGIDLSQSLTAIHHEIDRFALTKEIAALLKTNLIRNEDEPVRWLVNLRLLAFEGYENIGAYSLAEDNHKQWRKPVDYIYGGKSSYYDAEHHRRYCQYYPQMQEENFHGVKEAGHWVHADRPKEFL